MSLSSWLTLFRSHLTLERGLNVRKRQGVRRERRNPLLTNVLNAEDRTLLSGTGTVDAQTDIVVVEQPGIAIELDVLANDTESTSGDLHIIGFNQPISGTLSLIDGDESLGEHDKLLFTPASATFTGSLVFGYTVENASGTQDSASVQLVVQESLYGNSTIELPDLGSTTLSLGFAVGPNSSFSSQAMGNYSFSKTVTTTGTGSFTGDDGISYGQSDDLTRTLNVSRVTNSDGSWTYTESFIAGLGTEIDPSAGATAEGRSADVTNDYSYTFIATGSGDTVSYTFTTSSTVVDDGLVTSSWDNTDSETGLSNSGTKSNDYLTTTTETTTVTNSTNTSTGAATGSVSGSGGNSNSYSYGGDYSYDVSGGTVSGSYFNAGSDGTSYSIVGSVKTFTESGFYGFGYSGSGGYTVASAPASSGSGSSSASGSGSGSGSSSSSPASTWSISGTILESGSNGGDYS